MSHAYLTPAGGQRRLTRGEIALSHAVFGRAVDPAAVWIKRRKWFPLQPRDTVMAPSGHLHFHPASKTYSDDFSIEDTARQGLFVHEMAHVWQAQLHGRLWLPLMRHPFCRYTYTLRSQWPLTRYGIEQQAEIIRHAFLNRVGARIPEAHSPEILERLLRSLQQLTRR